MQRHLQVNVGYCFLRGEPALPHKAESVPEVKNIFSRPGKLVNGNESALGYLFCCILIAVADRCTGCRPSRLPWHRLTMLGGLRRRWCRTGGIEKNIQGIARTGKKRGDHRIRNVPIPPTDGSVTLASRGSGSMVRSVARHGRRRLLLTGLGLSASPLRSLPMSVPASFPYILKHALAMFSLTLGAGGLLAENASDFASSAPVACNVAPLHSRRKLLPLATD